MAFSDWMLAKMISPNYKIIPCNVRNYDVAQKRNTNTKLITVANHPSYIGTAEHRKIKN